VGGARERGHDRHPRGAGSQLNQLIAAEPLASFDYVWIVNTHRAGPVSNPALELSGATDRTALYRVIAAE
jgi:hypothetical protein